MRCHSLTIKGKKCKNNCFFGGTTCHVHAPECSICLSSLSKHDEVATLKCRHQFHAGCILNWCDQDKCRCPMCRAFVLTPSKIILTGAAEYANNVNLLSFVRCLIFSGELPGDKFIVEQDGEHHLKLKDEFTGIYIKDRVAI